MINNSDAKVGADLNVAFYSDGAENLDKESVNVARLAILPVVNEKNLSFSKELKKGIKSEELKQIFLRTTTKATNLERTRKVNQHILFIQKLRNQVWQWLFQTF